MKIIVLRHGKTEYNELNIIQGRTQIPLSQNGRKDLIEKAKEFNQSFDVIYSSPLLRTVQTAEIFNTQQSRPIIIDDRIIEIDEGIFTGRVMSYLTIEEQRIHDAKLSSAGMESIDGIIKRIIDFLDELRTKKEYNTVLVVTHGILTWLFDCILTGKEIQAEESFYNGETREYYI